MAKRTLYAYADGVNHADIADTVEATLEAHVASRAWITKDVWVVNQREPPHWDLGLNLALPGARSKTPVTEDVVAVVEALASLQEETGRSFVIGIHDPATDTTKDVFTVATPEPDLEALRAVLRDRV